LRLDLSKGKDSRDKETGECFHGWLLTALLGH
jgi:hypothetical protein